MRTRPFAAALAAASCLLAAVTAASAYTTSKQGNTTTFWICDVGEDDCADHKVPIVGTDGPDVFRLGNALGSKVDGGAGKDVFHGGWGADVLKGGAGADRFRYGPDQSDGFRTDVILDFDPAAGDVIDLRGFDGDTKRKGMQPFRYIGSRPFAEGQGAQIRFENGVLTAVTSGWHGDPALVLELRGVETLPAKALDLRTGKKSCGMKKPASKKKAC